MIETKDMALATTLRLEGFEPERMDVRGREAWWFFSDQAADTADRYWSNDLCVNPLRFAKCLKETRGLLFDFLNKRGVDAPY